MVGDYHLKIIKNHFSFLQKDFNFSDFKVDFYRDEINVFCNKEDIKFNVFWTSYSFPSVSIINTKEKIEFDNTFTPTNIYYVDDFEIDNIDINSISKECTEENEFKYFSECANILKRHTNVLNGDTSSLKKRKALNKTIIEITDSNNKKSNVIVNSFAEFTDLLKNITKKDK